MPKIDNTGRYLHGIDLLNLPDDFNVVYAQLPYRIKSLVSEKDGEYLILINTDHTKEEQEKAFCHEIRHILGDHFRSEETVSHLEKHTHNC